MRNDYDVAGLNSRACTFRSPRRLPVVAEEIEHAAVAFVEAVGDLEHGERHAALGPGPRFVAAAGGTPHEIARFAHALAAIERAFENEGLLYHHVLVVRQTGPGRHFRENRQHARSRIGQKRLGLDSRVTGFLPGSAATLTKRDASGDRLAWSAAWGVRALMRDPPPMVAALSYHWRILLTDSVGSAC